MSLTSVHSESSVCTGTLPFSITGGEEVVSEILLGGQSFLWDKAGQNCWVGVQERKVFRLVLGSDNRLNWGCLSGPSSEACASIESLFAVSTDFEELTDRLPWRSDFLLQSAIQNFMGLRILRQDCGVILLSFLLSPLKRIDQIREGLRSLSKRWGDPLGSGFHAPPEWSTLKEVPEKELRECGIGYRARSIHKTSKVLAAKPCFLEEMEEKSTAEARKGLMTLPGVGRKIADCVLLFGLGRLEAFPIDTWIHRFLVEEYQLTDYSENQLQTFAAAHFGMSAGFAQQFLFAHARKNLAQ
ncbi:MAG: DNA glycosylase [Verrucomicrobiota bacterium]